MNRITLTLALAFLAVIAVAQPPQFIDLSEFGNIHLEPPEAAQFTAEGHAFGVTGYQADTLRVAVLPDGREFRDTICFIDEENWASTVFELSGTWFQNGVSIWLVGTDPSTNVLSAGGIFVSSANFNGSFGLMFFTGEWLPGNFKAQQVAFASNCSQFL